MGLVHPLPKTIPPLIKDFGPKLRKKQLIAAKWQRSPALWEVTAEKLCMWCVVSVKIIRRWALLLKFYLVMCSWNGFRWNLWGYVCKDCLSSHQLPVDILTKKKLKMSGWPSEHGIPEGPSDSFLSNCRWKTSAPSRHIQPVPRATPQWYSRFEESMHFM